MASSGFSQIRLYQNTTSSIPVGVYTDVTNDFISTADSSTVIEDELYDYDGCNKTVTGLSPGTQYYFWVECIDEAGNSSGIQSLGSITTASPPATAPLATDDSFWQGFNRMVASGDWCMYFIPMVYLTGYTGAVYSDPTYGDVYLPVGKNGVDFLGYYSSPFSPGSGPITYPPGSATGADRLANRQVVLDGIAATGATWNSLSYNPFSLPGGIGGRPDANPYSQLYFTTGNWQSGWPANTALVRVLEIWYEGTRIVSMATTDTQELLTSNGNQIIHNGYRYIPGSLVTTWFNGDAAHKLNVTRVAV